MYIIDNVDIVPGVQRHDGVLHARPLPGGVLQHPLREEPGNTRVCK